MSNQNPTAKPSTPKNGGVTSKLANWISTTELSSIPPDVRTRAKHLILDGLACALVGARLPFSETATNAILAIEPLSSSTLIGWGPENKLSPMATTLLNFTCIQSDNDTTTNSVAYGIMILAAESEVAGLATQGDRKVQ